MSLCGAGVPVREMMAAKKGQKALIGVRAEITRACALLLAAMREVFDESAYERFLARAQMRSSPAAYSDFLRETETARARRPKCC